MAKMPIKKKHKITEAEISSAVDAIDQFLVATTGKFGAKWKKRDGFIKRRVAKQAYDAFLTKGGRSGDWQAFLAFLKEFLPLLLSLLAPFLL